MSPRLRRVLYAALVAGVFAGAGIAAIVGGVAFGRSRLAPPDEPDGSGQPIECLGAPSAAHRAVYLHGLDTAGPSWQELHNRDVLAELAARFDLRLALPRAVCSGGRCWPEAERALPWIRSAARACFGDKRLNGLIGFSNGGFLVGGLARACGGGSGADWLLVASAGGTVNASQSANPGVDSLSACPQVRVVIGRDDRYHRDWAQALARDLADRHADVRLIEFDGGHELRTGPVGEALADLIGPPGSARPPWHATHAVFAVAGALLLLLLFALRRWRTRRRLAGTRRNAHHLMLAGMLGVECGLGVSPGGAFSSVVAAFAAAAILAVATGAAAGLHAREPRAGAIAALAAAASFALGGAGMLAAVLWIL